MVGFAGPRAAHPPGCRTKGSLVALLLGMTRSTDSDPATAAVADAATDSVAEPPAAPPDAGFKMHCRPPARMQD